MPWRDDIQNVPDSYPQAMSRFLSLERRMAQDANFANAYDVFMNNMLAKDYAEECAPETYYISHKPENPPKNIRFYLPHFGVYHPQKRKLRVVHDAAATNKGVSLNSMLLPGPDLLQSLLHILFRFREGRVALTADIKEMFPQIRIREQDRDALRYLWRPNKSQPLKEYRMTAVIFGASCSPFIAQFIKNKNAREYELLYPKAVDAILHSHYMDDYIDSLDDADEAAQLAADVVTVHKAACFEMRGWISNIPTTLNLVPADLRATPPAAIDLTNPANNVRALGILWNPSTDELGFRTAISETLPNPLTKRSVLSHLMRVYDPLGLLGPVVVKGRILFQQAWRSNVDWDTELPAIEALKWKDWFQELSKITFLRIPRWYSKSRNSEPLQRELHVFADASELAYACVAYWRLIYLNGNIKLVLISSKARVSPLKPVSIPRLELQAALIASRLATTIKDSHRKKPNRSFFWIDSMTVLQWLRSDARSYKPFVAHRLGEILETSFVKDWRWVPTSLNVADDATRTKDLNFDLSHRWFCGPSFLLLPRSVTPASTTLPPLSADLIKAAERHILQRTQLESFPDDFRNVLNSKEIPRSSRLAKLSPVFGEDCLLRMDGRIKAVEDVDPDTRSPILLDGRHKVIQLLVQHYHHLAGHANNSFIINEIRQRFWILHLRNTVRTVATRCLLCRIRKAKPSTPVTGDLPPERLAHHKRPFTFTGLDYFGPMTVTIGRRHEKRWVALFTCLTTRALHLELVHSLSTDSAIMSIRRFIARRGVPDTIFSDNGTAFVGANRILKEFLKNDVLEFVATKGINWRFIPPAAPSFGGCWERLVRTVKVALNATLKERAPKEETLLTLLCEAEIIVNSRPLSHVSLDPNDPTALTPSHFLIGTASRQRLPVTSSDQELVGRNEWRKALRLADHFWVRWIKEVLPLMQPRQFTGGKPGEALKIGDVVIVADDQLPRGVWPRGRVTTLYPGKDGVTRVVDVETPGGSLRRPVKKLVKLAT